MVGKLEEKEKKGIERGRGLNIYTGQDVGLGGRLEGRDGRGMKRHWLGHGDR